MSDKKLTPEELEQQQKNRAILKKVQLWQAFKYVKPLVCRNCGELLIPEEQKSKVILRCPKCGMVQPYVPRNVIKSNLEDPNVLTRNQQRFRQPFKDTFTEPEDKD